MDEYGILVFRDQPFSDDEHLGFAQRLDEERRSKPRGNEALADVSNLTE